MNRRKKVEALSAADLRLMAAAEEASKARGHPLSVMITVQLGLTNGGRRDPGGYLRREVVGRLGTWMRRRGLPWLAIWVREAFEGEGREHVHIALALPPEYDADLKAAVARWWPEKIGDIRRFSNSLDLIIYLGKQNRAAPADVPAILREIRQQARCSRDGAPVSAVLGRRLGTSRALGRLLRNSPPRETIIPEVHHA